MATTSPARIEDDLYAAAKLVGEAQSRSASQQVAHWARIGREIEASASISHREIAQVLAGSSSYDALGPKEQAVVRAEWAERMATRREALDLAERFSAEGRTWVELGADGGVVERGPESGKRAPSRTRTGAQRKMKPAATKTRAGTSTTGTEQRAARRRTAD